MLLKLKQLIKHEWTKKGYIIVVSLFFLGSVTSMIFASSPKSEQKNTVKDYVKKYSIIYPKKFNDEKKILIGKVLSHESARVFPRRSGIVEDILVDIGDKVKKGQVLAYLLPGGVENESALEIQAQRSMMIRAADDYTNTKAISIEKIKNLEEKLNQERVRLERLKEDNYKDGYNEDSIEAENLRLQNEQLQLEYDQLKLLKVEYNEKLKIQIVNIDDANNEILHAKNNYRAAFDYVLQVAYMVLAGDNSVSGVPSGANFRTDLLSKELGIFSPQAQIDSVDMINLYITKLASLVNNNELIDSQYVELHLLGDRMLITLQNLLRSSGNITNLDGLSASVISAQDRLFKAQEKYENAEDMLNIIQSKDNKDLAIQLEKIQKQESKIIAIESSWEKNATEIQSKILIMEAGIRRLEQDIAYEESSVKKSIDSSKNQYNISNNNYRKTVAKKGHVKILAPFSGIIAKRNIEVGELAATSIASFDLVEVETSLSKKAKSEIQFGLPEDLQEVIAIGDIIQFYLPNDELTLHEAEVTRISPQVDEVLHTITVQAKLSDDLKLAHHTGVQVKIITGKRDTFKIDSSALKREDQKNYVWIKDGESITKLFIDVVEEDGEFAEVIAELSEESEIVTNYYGKGK